MHRVVLGSRLERWALAAAFVGAPLAYVAGQVLLVALPREATLFATLAAHAELWLFSHALLVVWLVLLIPVIWGMGALPERRGIFYRVIGSLLAALGVVVTAMITGVDFALGAIASLDERLSLDPVHQRIIADVLVPLDQLDITLPFGLLFLTIGLYRTRAAPQWLVLLVLTGFAIPGSADFRIVAGIVQLAGLTALGLIVARTSHAHEAEEATGYRYDHPVAGALVAALVVLPGAVFSLERLALGLLVWIGLSVPELWTYRGAWQQRTRD